MYFSDRQTDSSRCRPQGLGDVFGGQSLMNSYFGAAHVFFFAFIPFIISPAVLFHLAPLSMRAHTKKRWRIFTRFYRVLNYISALCIPDQQPLYSSMSNYPHSPFLSLSRAKLSYFRRALSMDRSLHMGDRTRGKKLGEISSGKTGGREKELVLCGERMRRSIGQE